MNEQIISLRGVIEVSGLGLMIGISLEEGLNAQNIAKRCVENGLLILTAKKNLRILPPLNITLDEIDRGMSILRHALMSKK